MREKGKNAGVAVWLLILFLLKSAGAAQADGHPLYDSSTSYVSGNTSFQRTAVRSGSGPYYDINAYSEAAPLSPVDGYGGSVFYGGYEFSSTTVDGGFSGEMIRNDFAPTSDQIYVQAYRVGGWQGSTLSMHGIYLFKPEEFGAIAETGAVVPDSLSMEITGYGCSVSGGGSAQKYDAQGRFVVKVGETLYVSRTNYNFSAAGSFSLAGAALSNELWAVYDPGSNLDFDQDSADFSALNLAGITGVGVYFEDDSWAGTNQYNSAFGLGIVSVGSSWHVQEIAYGPRASYVSGNVNFARTAVRSGSEPYYDVNVYSGTVPLSPDSGYSGPVFYGGYEFSSASVDGGFTAEMVRNDLAPTSDQIYVQAYRAGGWMGSTLSMHGIYLFKREDFNGGIETDPISLNSLSMEITGYGCSVSGGSAQKYDAQGRFAVKVGETLYVSRTNYNFSAAGSFSLAGAALSNELWAAYDPGSKLDFDQDSADFSALNLAGITGVGVYFEDDSWEGTNQYNSAFGLGIVSFDAMFSPAEKWGSELYGTNWSSTPALSFETDKIIQDFSYAGYARGEAFIPARTSAPVFCVTNAAYGADPSGTVDSTAAIQQAIDDAGALSGGGVVYLPEGTYLVSLPSGSNQCLLIDKDDVVVRGAGVGRTFILNTTTNMRSKSIIYASSTPHTLWIHPVSTPVNISTNLMGPTFTIPVDSVAGFNVGDRIVIRCDPTDDWLYDHNEYTWWKDYQTQIGCFLYYRTIVAIDSLAKTLTVDIPTRYMLKTTYDSQVYKVADMMSEVGIEDFSIGNVEHGGSGWENMDYVDSSTAAYDAHYSDAIRMMDVRNGWIKNVHTFRSASNSTGAHLLSNGIFLWECSNVSIVNCFFQKTPVRRRWRKWVYVQIAEL